MLLLGRVLYGVPVSRRAAVGAALSLAGVAVVLSNPRHRAFYLGLLTRATPGPGEGAAGAPPPWLRATGSGGGGGGGYYGGGGAEAGRAEGGGGGGVRTPRARDGLQRRPGFRLMNVSRRQEAFGLG